MQLFYFVFLLVLLPFAYSQDTNITATKGAFNSANIPAELGVTFQPRFNLEVIFPQPVGSINIHAGTPVPLNATIGPPNFILLGTSQIGPFVIISVDMDASNPQALQLLASNFSAPNPSPVYQSVTNSTPAITSYRQPIVPAESAAHRFVFLIYDQPEGFDNQVLVTDTSPLDNFNISAFAAATGLGAPIGGTFTFVA